MYACLCVSTHVEKINVLHRKMLRDNWRANTKIDGAVFVAFVAFVALSVCGR